METIIHYKAIDGEIFDDEVKCYEHEQEFINDVINKLTIIKDVCNKNNSCGGCPFSKYISPNTKGCFLRLSMTTCANGDNTFVFNYPDRWEFDW